MVLGSELPCIGRPREMRDRSRERDTRVEADAWSSGVDINESHPAGNGNPTCPLYLGGRTWGVQCSW